MLKSGMKRIINRAIPPRDANIDEKSRRWR
jgi:hypothetical protein